MRVLLTNDDGFAAEGLISAYKALKAAGHKVTVCAPDRERSAQSQSVTLRVPIEVRERPLPDGDLGFAISGTPADCARLGFTTLAPKPVDLVVSGVNNDFNLGFDVNYSGTVAAALEAAGAGYKAIAASLERSDAYDWNLAGSILIKVINNLSAWAIPKGVALNLNIPSQPTDLELVWTKPDGRAAPDTYHQELGPDGLGLYTRLRGDPLWFLDAEPDTDLALARSGRITLSPLISVRAHTPTLSRLLATSKD
ncbi:MAG: 5'/3'-nucleotidase SurE [Deltaproteobacteria bacterium]|nr:5'/3'-nucleotidase SurE [Deltaproteobacteria bacterium]